MIARTEWNVLAAQIVGNALAKSYIDIQRYKFAMPNGQKADLSIVVHVSVDSGQVNIRAKVETFVKECKEAIQALTQVDNYQAGSVYTCLEDIVKENQLKPLGIVVSLVIDKDCQLVVFGAGSVSLFRSKTLGEVINKQGFVSGKMEEKDILFLCTDGLFSVISYKQVELLLATHAHETVNEKASRLITQLSTNSSMGILLCEFEVVEKKHNSKRKTIKALASDFLGKMIPKKITARKSQVEDPVFLRDPGYNRRQKFGLLLFLGLIGLLSVSIFFGIKRRQSQELERQYEAVVLPAEELLAQAAIQKDVNQKATRSLLTQAREVLNQGQLPEQLHEDQVSRLEKLTKDIELAYQQVSGEYSVNPETFINLNLVSEDFFGSAMALEEDELYVLDTSAPLLLQIGAETKSSSVLAGAGDLAGSRLMSSFLEGALVLMNDGVVVVGQDVVELAVPKETEWQDVRAVEGFATNVYLVDGSLGEIWRYRQVAGNSYVRQRWLAPTVTPDFSETIDMMIDGDVWLLDSSGVVRQYSRGVSTGFSLDEDVVLKDPRSLFVEENVFVLDRGEKKIVQYSKEGVYQKQYFWEGLSVVSDMVVFEGKVYLLSGEEIVTFAYQSD